MTIVSREQPISQTTCNSYNNNQCYDNKQQWCNKSPSVGLKDFGHRDIKESKYFFYNFREGCCKECGNTLSNFDKELLEILLKFFLVKICDFSSSVFENLSIPLSREPANLSNPLLNDSAADSILLSILVVVFTSFLFSVF